MSKYIAWIVVLGAIAGGAYYFVFMGPHWSAEMREIVRSECQSWIQDEFGDGQRATVIDDWNKRSNAVFLIGVEREDSTSSSLYLCVVDPNTMMMTKPGIMAQQMWMR